MDTLGGTARRDPGAGRRWAAVVVSGALLLGCSGADDPPVTVDPAADSEATPSAVRTLTMAHIDAGDLDVPAGWFVDAVSEVSDGALTIEIVRECCGIEADVEQVLVEAVAAGEFDLGWVGTRVLDTLGVQEFAPLTAPLVLDSYALQAAVLADDEVTAPMLAALEPIGVTGIAVAPGDNRSPLAADGVLRGPADWSGVRVHAFRSQGNEDAIAAFGGIPVEAGFAERNAGLTDGSIGALENGLAFHATGAYDLTPYATSNVRLWPRVAALIGAPEVVDGLDPTQRTWLEEAAAQVVARTADLADRDERTVVDGCAKGARYGEASEAELAALREAVAPILRRLEQDPATAAAMARIGDLAATVTAEPPPTIPAGCTDSDPITAAGGDDSAWDGPTIPDGTYEKHVHRDDALAIGVPEWFLDQPDEFRGIDDLHIVHRFEGGRYQQLANYVGGMQVGDRGRYSYDAEGRLVKVSESGGCPGCTATYTWTLEDDVLVLEVVEGLGDEPLWDDLDRAIAGFFDSGELTHVP
jgi:TRAP-type transport system periplasmic protein